jgi:hypothetical protein
MQAIGRMHDYATLLFCIQTADTDFSSGFCFDVDSAPAASWDFKTASLAQADPRRLKKVLAISIGLVRPLAAVAAVNAQPRWLQEGTSAQSKIDKRLKESDAQAEGDTKSGKRKKRKAVESAEAEGEDIIVAAEPTTECPLSPAPPRVRAHPLQARQLVPRRRSGSVVRCSCNESAPLGPPRSEREELEEYDPTEDVADVIANDSVNSEFFGDTVTGSDRPAQLLSFNELNLSRFSCQRPPPFGRLGVLFAPFSILHVGLAARARAGGSGRVRLPPWVCTNCIVCWGAFGWMAAVG